MREFKWYENEKYEDVVKYNIYAAIELKASEQECDYSSKESRQKYFDNNIALIPHHPLLLDYNYVYNNCEHLFIHCMLIYQQKQGFEEYYFLFKVMTQKYNIEEDYDRMLLQNNDMIKFNAIVMKWTRFAREFVSFFGHAFDERLDKLIEQKDFYDYFVSHTLIYDHDALKYFGDSLGKFLECGYISSYYTDKKYRMIALLRDNLRINVPSNVMLNKKLIEQITHTPDIERFHYDMIFIEEQVITLKYYEEHSKYCDQQIEESVDGILPCLMEEYKNSPKMLSKKDISHAWDNKFRINMSYRIFERSGKEKIHKKYFYQELSKYLIINMFISRNCQTSPYNLLIDINNFTNFAKRNNRQLKGEVIYEFLINCESLDVFKIIELYKKFKGLPLMEMLYDDYQNQKQMFINEINKHIIDIKNMKSKCKHGIKYFDISDSLKPILVHNTSISINNREKLIEMMENIKNGKKYKVCLSLQDHTHQQFYSEYEKDKTLKLVYGKLDHKRVGIMFHSDAYSQFVNSVELEHFGYNRLLYTLNEFMNKTKRYNEISYLVDGEPFIPIGVLCENELTKEEVAFARSMGINIFYRNSNEIESVVDLDQEKVKAYHLDARGDHYFND